MAYNILKHRRGTTQEWLDIDLVPEDGELVIEERLNCFSWRLKLKIKRNLERNISKLNPI